MFERLGQNRLIPKLLIVTMLYLSGLSTVNAAMISSTDLVAQQEEQIARDTLLQTLDREDVKTALVARGVDPALAKQRVASMTAEEVALLSQKMDDLPAGGDILGVAVLVFLVLLFTDIMGYTDVFPFVKKTAQ